MYYILWHFSVQTQANGGWDAQVPKRCCPALVASFTCNSRIKWSASGSLRIIGNLASNTQQDAIEAALVFNRSINEVQSGELISQKFRVLLVLPQIQYSFNEYAEATPRWALNHLEVIVDTVTHTRFLSVLYWNTNSKPLSFFSIFKFQSFKFRVLCATIE